MKKIMLVVLLVCLLLVSSALAVVPFGNSPQILVTLASQSPDPVEPGQIVTVKFKIENAGRETINQAFVKFLPSGPFSLYGDVATKNVGTLRSNAQGADAVVVEYKVKVAEDAIEGNNEMEIELNIGESSISYTNDEFLIDVQTHDAIMEITSLTYEPEQLVPGRTQEIDIRIKNLADSLLKDIKFTLDFSDADLPIAPFKSLSQRRISNLPTNRQKPLHFEIVANPEAAPGLYKIPLNVTYNDEKGKSYSLNDVLAITVGEKPQVKPYIKKSTVLQAGKAGKLTLEIANSGTTDIKFLQLSLLPCNDYDLISTSNYVYVGDVDSDDTESEEFDIFVRKGQKNLSVPVELTYYDANNKPFKEKHNLLLQLYSPSELRRFGVLARNNTWMYIILIGLAAGGYFYYRKRKKK